MAIHGLSQTLRYTVVDAGQLKCYSSTGEMTCPTSGQPFFGQDAHYSIHPASYVLSADTKTVYDRQHGFK